MEDFKKHLAEQVLSEEKVLTYRTLSRALHVNVNIAKQMLYEFHTLQNAKHPGTVHATYMIYGVKRTSQSNGHSSNDDVEMTSSPPVAPSLPEEIPVTTLSLVAEEQLVDALSQYESVATIHIYSLGPHAVKDIQLLADISRPILDGPAVKDTANPAETMGPIRNPYVRRRNRPGAVPKPAPVAKQAEVKPAALKPAAAKPTPAQEVKEESQTEKKPSSKESTPAPSGQGTKKPAAKRGASGGIMQSFAKAASMPKKPAKARANALDSVDDSSMQALSDDGEDDSPALPEPKEEDATANMTRKDRKAELKRMMEESSEDEEPEKEDTPMEEPIEEPPALEPEAKEPESAEVISSAGGGRRRGKRRVMKKKTVMDEQGYLVTRQEAAWESFSEDEPAPPPKKKSETPSQPAKSKKAAPKGQGNIMSFFGRK